MGEAVRRVRPRAADVEAVRWDGSEGVLAVLREWDADPCMFPGQPLRIWGGRYGYSGVLQGEWCVRDRLRRGAARWMPDDFEAAFEAPGGEGRAAVPGGDLAAAGLIAERATRLLSDLSGGIGAVVARAVAAERARILADASEASFRLFRPGNGPAHTRQMDVVPLEALARMVSGAATDGPEPDTEATGNPGEGNGLPEGASTGQRAVAAATEGPGGGR